MKLKKEIQGKEDVTVSRSMVPRTVESKEFRKSKEAEQEDSGLVSEEETRKSSCSQDTRKSSCSQEPVSLRGAEVGSTGRLGTPGGRNCHLLNLNKVNTEHVLTAGSDRLQPYPRSDRVHRQ